MKVRRFIVVCRSICRDGTYAAAELADEFEKARGVTVEIFYRAAAQQRRTHLVSDAAAKTTRAQSAQELAVIDEAFVDGHGLYVGAQRRIVHHGGIIMVTRPLLVSRNGGVHR